MTLPDLTRIFKTLWPPCIVFLNSCCLNIFHAYLNEHSTLCIYKLCEGGAENRPIRKIVPKGKKENAPIFQNSKK